MRLVEKYRSIYFSVPNSPTRAIGWFDSNSYLTIRSDGAVLAHKLQCDQIYAASPPLRVEGVATCNDKLLLLATSGFAQVQAISPPQFNVHHFHSNVSHPYYAITFKRKIFILTSDWNLHDPESNITHSILRTPPEEKITSCAPFGEDTLVIGTDAGSILLIRPDLQETLYRKRAHASDVSGLTYCSGRLFSIGRDRMLIEWNVKRDLRRIRERAVPAFHFLNKIASCSGTLVIADAAGHIHVSAGPTYDHFITARIHADSIRHLSISASNEHALTDSDDGTVALIELKTRKILRQHGTQREYIRAAANVEFQGESVRAIGTNDGLVHLAHSTHQHISAVSGLGAIRCLESMPNGRLIVGDEAGQLAIYSLQKKCIERRTMLESAPYCMRWDPFRRRLVVGLRSGHLVLLDGELRTVSEAALHQNIIGDVGVTEDCLITCSDDGIVNVCEPYNLRRIGQIAPEIAALNNIGIDKNIAYVTSDSGVLFGFEINKLSISFMHKISDKPLRAVAIISENMVAVGDRQGAISIRNNDSIVGKLYFSERIVRIRAQSPSILEVVTEQQAAKLETHLVQDPNVHGRVAMVKRTGGPRRSKDVANVLHLSDLHFNSKEPFSVTRWQTQLREDLSRNMELDSLDAIVISGDLTTAGTREEFALASKFIEGIVGQFNCALSNVLVIPGNHDIDWESTRRDYNIVRKINFKPGAETHSFKEFGDYVEAINNFDAANKLNNFREFHVNSLQRHWGIEPSAEHCALMIGGDFILMAGLNSSWQIDHHFPKRISIHPEAFSHVIDASSQSENSSLWKVLVVHHPIGTLDDEKIQGSGELEQLATAGFQVVLHGHVHKPNSGRYFHDITDSGRQIHIVGAGTFGAPVRSWHPGFPLGYNLLKFTRDRAVVETRKRETVSGAWRADARWTEKPGADPLPRYVIKYPELNWT